MRDLLDAAVEQVRASPVEHVPVSTVAPLEDGALQESRFVLGEEEMHQGARAGWRGLQALQDASGPSPGTVRHPTQLAAGRRAEGGQSLAMGRERVAMQVKPKTRDSHRSRSVTGGGSAETAGPLASRGPHQPAGWVAPLTGRGNSGWAPFARFLGRERVCPSSAARPASPLGCRRSRNPARIKFSRASRPTGVLR